MRIRYCLFVIALVGIFSAKAQNHKVDSVQIVWTDSSYIHVSFLYSAPEKGIDKDERLLVLPKLTSESGSSKDLRPVAFAGKRNIKVHKRSHLYNIYKELTIHAPGSIVRFEQTIPVERWMLKESVALKITTELENCCNIIKSNNYDLASTVYIAPATPVAPWIPEISKDVREFENVSEFGKFLIPIEEYQAFDPKNPLGGDSECESIIFELAKSNIDTTIRNNREVLDRMVRMMEYIKKDSYLEIEKIRLVGAASPEGSLALNTKLAEARVKVLKDYIQARVQMDNHKYEIISIPEAWVDVRAAIAAGSMSEREEMLEIIDNTPDVNRREALLRQLNGGKPFKELCNTVFADNRLSGRIKVYYSNVNRELLKRAIALYLQQDYQGAYNTLLPIKEDSRTFNILGASAYMLGMKKEARHYFESGTKANDVWAEKNLKEMPDK